MDSKQFKSVYIAAIVVPVVVILLATLLVILWIVRRRRTKSTRRMSFRNRALRRPLTYSEEFFNQQKAAAIDDDSGSSQENLPGQDVNNQASDMNEKFSHTQNVITTNDRKSVASVSITEKKSGWGDDSYSVTAKQAGDSSTTVSGTRSKFAKISHKSTKTEDGSSVGLDGLSSNAPRISFHISRSLSAFPIEMFGLDEEMPSFDDSEYAAAHSQQQSIRIVPPSNTPSPESASNLSVPSVTSKKSKSGKKTKRKTATNGTGLAESSQLSLASKTSKASKASKISQASKASKASKSSARSIRSTSSKISQHKLYYGEGEIMPMTERRASSLHHRRSIASSISMNSIAATITATNAPLPPLPKSPMLALSNERSSRIPYGLPLNGSAILTPSHTPPTPQTPAPPPLPSKTSSATIHRRSMSSPTTPSSPATPLTPVIPTPNPARISPFGKGSVIQQSQQQFQIPVMMTMGQPSVISPDLLAPPPSATMKPLNIKKQGLMPFSTDLHTPPPSPPLTQGSIHIVRHSSTSSAPTKIRKSLAVAENDSLLDVFRVLHPYAPAMEDEMELRRGDKLIILQIFDDGWCFARLILSNYDFVAGNRMLEGICPRACVSHMPLTWYD